MEKYRPLILSIALGLSFGCSGSEDPGTDVGSSERDAGETMPTPILDAESPPVDVGVADASASLEDMGTPVDTGFEDASTPDAEPEDTGMVDEPETLEWGEGCYDLSTLSAVTCGTPEADIVIFPMATDLDSASRLRAFCFVGSDREFAPRMYPDLASIPEDATGCGEWAPFVAGGPGLDRVGLLIRGSDGTGLWKMWLISNRGIVRFQIARIE